MNVIQLTGHLTADPEQRTTTSGMAVCNFTIAVDRRPASDHQADFIRCTAWDKIAENICRYKHKGDFVGIVGSLHTGTYLDKENRRREKFYVNVTQAEYYGKAAPAENTGTVQITDGADDDFPF